MSRATFILGFAVLVIAATLAASITMRNAPGDSRAAARPGTGTPKAADAPAHANTPGLPAGATAINPGRPVNRKIDSLRVTLPEQWLAALPSEQQVEWRTRAAAVESDARVRLDRLNTELNLNAAQRDKMFPVLVRSAPGYSPAMLVGGSAAIPETALAADEAMHQVLDPQQQALVEDQEVNRQLWWQDTLARLEADLLESTGGKPTAPAATPSVPVDSPPAAERVAPAARDSGNLFDLLEPNP